MQTSEPVRPAVLPTPSRKEQDHDPITFEVVSSALIATAREMSVVMERTSYSEVFSEGLDYSVAIFDRSGQLAAQAERSPVHLAAMQYSVQAALRCVGIDSLAPGDVLLHNDPYLGGTHVSDLTVLAPVFVGGELQFFVANRGHHVDFGGMSPGGFSHLATEVIQEGIIVPVLKLHDAGRLNEAVLELLLANVRLPHYTRGDIEAQVGSCHRGELRLFELVERYGLDTVHSVTGMAMDHSERRMRAEIAAVPDGVYAFTDYLDDDGQSEAPMAISVRITINDDTAEVDFDGTAAQSSGPVNAAFAVTAAATYLEFLTLTDPTIPVNHGCYRPIHLVVPEGSLVNPRRPAACQFGNTETAQRICDCIRGALSKAIPDRTAAAGMGTSRQAFGFGRDPSGRYYVWLQYPGGGFGASRGCDGQDAVVSELSNCAATPVEVFETQYPWRVRRQELRTDSGGAGEFRGGLGQIKEYELIAEEAAVTTTVERTKFPPWGLFGGEPGGLTRYSIVDPDGVERILPGKSTDVALRCGSRLVLRTPGGGGYGDPRARDPEKLAADVRQGYVSEIAATRAYGLGESR